MNLPSDLRARAQAVGDNPNYRGENLGAKTIIAIEAPFATGKSTVSDKCIEMLANAGIDAGIIGTETTREHRDNDPATYMTEVDPRALIEKGEAGQLINLTPFPTGHLYATSAASIPYDVNIGPVMPAALQKFKDAGCGSVCAFYLTTTPQQWQQQLDKDARLARPDAEKRIDEALSSLTHIIENPGRRHVILINNDGSRTVEQLAGLVLYRSGFDQFERYDTDTPSYAHEMFDYALRLKQRIGTN